MLIEFWAGVFLKEFLVQNTFARLFDLRLEEEKKQLLRRLRLLVLLRENALGQTIHSTGVLSEFFQNLSLFLRSVDLSLSNEFLHIEN